MSNKALSYMLATTLALSVVAIKPASAQNLWQNLQQQATPFFKSAVGKVKQNIQGKMNGSGSGQGSMPPAGYGNGYQPANDRGANGVPGSGYQGGGYQSQGNGYQGQGNGYQNQGNGYGDPSQGYANQGNTYQPDYQPNSGGPPQGNGYQSPGGYQQQGSGYQPQGNGYQSQGGYQPQSGGYQPQNSDYPIGGNQPQGNEYMRGDGNGGYGAPPATSGFNAPSSAPTPNPDYKPVHLGGGRMNSRQMFKQPSN
jgi:hypothetical protein